MAKSFLKVKFDEASMRRKLKKVEERYENNQAQAVKRWGVMTCRELAKYTQIFGSKPSFHKATMFKDALRVIYTHEGTSKSTASGRSISFKVLGVRRTTTNDKYMMSEAAVIKWIDQNRTGKHRHTVRIPPNKKKACSNALLRRAINRKHKLTSGMAKDGWLDAGEQIAKGQRGDKPDKIGLKLMKFARKPARLGSVKEGSRGMKSFGILTNKVSYVSSSNVLSAANKKKAIRDGMSKTMKWYKHAIKAENKKKK